MDVLTDEQISERLAGVPGWARQGDSIVHAETLADFKAAIFYVGAVAYLAEAANHHPDYHHPVEQGHLDPVDPLGWRPDRERLRPG